MKDIEKAAAKLHSLKVEMKAASNRSADIGELERTRQDARNIIDSINVGIPDEPSLSSIGTVDIFADPQVELSVAPLPYSTANGGQESKPPIDQDFDFREIKIPLKALRKSGHITPSVEKNKLTEQYRRIKRPLILNLNNADIPTNRNLVMVTSAMEGEGKTYTSINLAMSLAQERGRSVIFVDADILKGSAGRKLGVSSGAPGLIDVLSGTATDVREVIQRTNVPNLWFISAGNSDSHAYELLASDSMEQFIQDINNLFEDCILVFDCPPILLTNEANVLLHHAGQIVFVVAERLTSQKHVDLALAQLDDSKYIGIILNKSKNRQAVYSYGYG